VSEQQKQSPTKKRRRVRKRRSTAEALIQKDIVTALTRMGIVVNRVNSGAQRITDEGRTRVFRCNSLNGKSDLEFWMHYENEDGFKIPVSVYAEVKSEKGKQLPSQVEYQRLMEKTGQHYMIARSVPDIINFICDLKDDEQHIPGFKLVIGRIKNIKRVECVRKENS